MMVGARETYQRVHGTGFFVVIETWPLLTRDVNQTRQIVSIKITHTVVTEENLYENKPMFLRNLPAALCIMKQRDTE